jgi:hypothetical protein
LRLDCVYQFVRVCPAMTVSKWDLLDQKKKEEEEEAKRHAAAEAMRSVDDDIDIDGQSVT